MPVFSPSVTIVIKSKISVTCKLIFSLNYKVAADRYFSYKKNQSFFVAVAYEVLVVLTITSLRNMRYSYT